MRKIFIVNHEEWGAAAAYSSCEAAENWVSSRPDGYAYRVIELLIDDDYRPIS